MTIQRFDFNAFVHHVCSLPATQIRERTENEIAGLNKETPRETKVEIERLLYLRKLARLLYFLDRRKLPPDVTPKERMAYERLSEWLAQEDNARPPLLAR